MGRKTDSILKVNLFVGLCLVLLGCIFLLPKLAAAHCDTLSGPVIKDAKIALEKGDVAPVLKWVKKDDEQDIRDAFKQALSVRGLSPEAKAMADMYFFETLVRIHRAGEGAPYTGIKPAGTDLGPAVEGADAALETGKIENVVKLMNKEVSQGITKRFKHVLEKKKLADKSVEAGREFVAAYVEYVHYIEGLYDKAASGAIHHEEAVEKEKKAPAHHH